MPQCEIYDRSFKYGRSSTRRTAMLLASATAWLRQIFEPLFGKLGSLCGLPQLVHNYGVAGFPTGLVLVVANTAENVAIGPAQAVGSSRDETSAAQSLVKALEIFYEPLLARLASKLRSKDLAKEALHDAYLRLCRLPSLGAIERPQAYLYRMAVNLAENQRVRERRYGPLSARDAIAIVDSSPSPEQYAAGRMEMRIAIKALHELPSRRRAIFLACWQDGKSQQEIATDFGLHKRTIQKELYRAEQYLRRACCRRAR